MPTAPCGFDSAGPVTGRLLLAYKGPTIAVDIGFDPNYDPANPELAVLPSIGVDALVDTGAAMCCIDSQLAMALNLPIVDQQTCAGAGGLTTHNMHLAQMRVPGIDKVVTGQFMGVHLAAGGQGHSALIGRTLLADCTMHYNGLTGEVTLTA